MRTSIRQAPAPNWRSASNYRRSISSTSRAWTIPAGTKAPQAAGRIHTDFERGFIAADTIAYDDYVKAAGKLRTEGKDYVVKEADVIEFKFNV